MGVPIYLREVREAYQHSLNFSLTQQKANVFDAEHLQGSSPELVRSMFQVGCKAAELERTKLQSEIQRGRSEIRRQQLEKRLAMANKLGGRSVPPAKPKNTKEEEEDDYLEDLVVDADKKQKSYAKMETGGFVTRGADRKSRLDQRKAKIAATTEEPEDDKEDETEQQKLEREVLELTSQLKKAERAKEQARDKEERTKARRFSARITAGRYMKPPKAVTLVETRKCKKSMKTENILSAEEGEDEIDDIPEGFHLAAERPSLHKHEEVRGLPGLPMTGGVAI